MKLRCPECGERTSSRAEIVWCQCGNLLDPYGPKIPQVRWWHRGRQPGWYNDPRAWLTGDRHIERSWTGEAWTTSIRLRPGWYLDAESGWYDYWSGEDWTDQRRPEPHECAHPRDQWISPEPERILCQLCESTFDCRHERREDRSVNGSNVGYGFLCLDCGYMKVGQGIPSPF